MVSVNTNSLFPPHGLSATICDLVTGRWNVMTTVSAQPDLFGTVATSRLGCPPWARVHALAVVAPGITWSPDEPAVTLVGSLSGAD